MCGICGFTRGTFAPEPILEEMLSRIAHRGPDDEGCFFDEKIALGHRRLAVIDLTEGGHQPFFYGKGERFVLVYNGEIYNYLELREELREQGFLVTGQSDTEVLVAAYACWGESCLSHLNGMFSFSLYDRNQGSLFCARDRFGVKPFYHTRLPEGRFAFASEIKQLLALPSFPIKANQKRLASFLLLGELDTTEDTLFAGVQQLPPGGCLRYNLAEDTLNIWRWYDIEKACPTTNTPPDETAFLKGVEEFRSKFTSAVGLRLRSDVPVGYCLSGGLDSSAIVAVATRTKGTNEFPDRCIHSLSRHEAYDEYRYAVQVAKANGVELHTVEADSKKLFTQMDEIVWQMDEPFGSTSIYAQWCVFKKAKELGLTVMLDGQGADEQLAGYTPFVPVWLAGFLRQGRPMGYRTALASWLTLEDGRQQMAHKINILAYLYAYLSPKLSKKLLSQFQARPGGPFSSKLKRLALAAAQPDNVKNGQTFVRDNLRHGLQALLHYEDRNSMAFSIESRVPFLDKNLVEAMYTLPLECKLQNGQSKAVMRTALADILPETVINRQDKMGFVTPEAEWIKDDPATFRQELAAACRQLAPLLNEKKILAWFDKGGGQNRGDFTVWRIICAGHWAKLFGVAL